MKVLLDENLPHDLRHHLAGHEAFTVTYMGWSGTKNGVLLQRAAGAGFDVMLTMDDGVAYQQNAAALPVAVVILSAPSNDIDDLLPLVPALLGLPRPIDCAIDREGAVKKPLVLPFAPRSPRLHGMKMRSGI